MARPLITLTTDFGLTDGFVGSMKGVIASIAPETNVVDITHDVPPQDLRYGAFVLGSAYRYFPGDAIHVIVIDPGVGTRRRPIAIQTEHGTFICPDNGCNPEPTHPQPTSNGAGDGCWRSPPPPDGAIAALRKRPV